MAYGTTSSNGYTLNMRFQLTPITKDYEKSDTIRIKQISSLLSQIIPDATIEIVVSPGSTDSRNYNITINNKKYKFELFNNMFTNNRRLQKVGKLTLKELASNDIHNI